MSDKISYHHADEIHNTRAAEAFIPRLLNYIKPRSAVDFGCGLGCWLKVLEDNGCTDILGIDGPNVDKERLIIDPGKFLVHDLTEPVLLDKKFDLAICLEVAEHLPENTSDIIIQSLTRSADTILFSAALPLQGGQFHLNEQPFKYWVKKFNECGFIVEDLFRRELWENQNIHWWYRQNIFLIKKTAVPLNQLPIPDYYHPESVMAKQRAIDELTSINRAKEEANNNILQGRLSVNKAAKIFVKAILNVFGDRKD